MWRHPPSTEGTTQLTDAIAIVVIILMIVAAYYLYRALFFRGLRRVVATFREHKALDAKRAETLAELGLQPPPYIRRMFRPRDYRQSAADLLHREGIIKVVEGGRVYLSETDLGQSRLSKYID